MRIVALSDLHGFLPDVQPCDLLIIAGDLCPDRFGPFMAAHDPHQQQAWFDCKIRPWLAAAPATHKLLTWGESRLVRAGLQLPRGLPQTRPIDGPADPRGRGNDRVFL